MVIGLRHVFHRRKRYLRAFRTSPGVRRKMEVIVEIRFILKGFEAISDRGIAGCRITSVIVEQHLLERRLIDGSEEHASLHRCHLIVDLIKTLLTVIC